MYVGLDSFVKRLILKGDLSEDFIKIGTVSAAVDTTGVKTVSETFSKAFPNDIDDVILQIYDVDDPNLNIGYIGPSGMSVSGFTAVVNVIASGATGLVAKIKYLALGH